MGVERTIYLGPYIEVRSPKHVERIDRCRNPDECPNPESSHQTDKGFCKTCGIELKGRIYTTSRRPDFVGMFDEALIQCVDNLGKSPLEHEYGNGEEDFFRDCLVPNLANNIFERGSQWLESSAQDMTRFAHGNECQWMRKNFKKEIMTLIELFGEDNVRTRWGFLSYCS
jgi:hypothetical protein